MAAFQENTKTVFKQTQGLLFHRTSELLGLQSGKPQGG